MLVERLFGLLARKLILIESKRSLTDKGLDIRFQCYIVWVRFRGQPVMGGGDSGVAFQDAGAGLRFPLQPCQWKEHPFSFHGNPRSRSRLWDCP